MFKKIGIEEAGVESFYLMDDDSRVILDICDDVAMITQLYYGKNGFASYAIDQVRRDDVEYRIDEGRLYIHLKRWGGNHAGGLVSCLHCVDDSVIFHSVTRAMRASKVAKFIPGVFSSWVDE